MDNVAMIRRAFLSLFAMPFLKPLLPKKQMSCIVGELLGTEATMDSGGITFVLPKGWEFIPVPKPTLIYEE